MKTKKAEVMETTNLPQVLKVKEMWEKYNTNVIKDQLDEQVSFSCPSTLVWIGGKQNVIKYLKMVLQGSRTLDFFFGLEREFEVIKVSRNEYSLRIHQTEDDTETICCLNVEILEDKIFCIEMEKLR